VPAGGFGRSERRFVGTVLKVVFVGTPVVAGAAFVVVSALGQQPVGVSVFDGIGEVAQDVAQPGEERSIFLDLLIPKLPSPREDDLSRGILEAIDMESYRVEKRAAQGVLLPDEDAMIDPVPTAGGGGRPEPDVDMLSNILRVFNEHFGDIPWEDADRVRQLISETIPSRVAEDTAFRNARRNSDEQNARIEHDRALLRVMTSVMKDDTELFKQFMDNDGFKRWMTDTVFDLAFDRATAE